VTCLPARTHLDPPMTRIERTVSVRRPLCY
jgi:hypothetical protein